MLNIISIYNLLHLLILLNIIPISLSTKSSLKFAFIDGHNFIRCSDYEIRFRWANTGNPDRFKQFMSCGDEYIFDDDFYAGLQWAPSEIQCTKDGTQIKEKQKIKKVDTNGANSVDLSVFNIAERVDDSEEPIRLSVEKVGEEFILESELLSTNEERNRLKNKKIYLTFGEQPIICRIKYYGSLDDLCGNFLYVGECACYYDLSSGKTPSIELMEAEYEEYQKREESRIPGEIVLSMQRPKVKKVYLDGDFDVDSGSKSDGKSKSTIQPTGGSGGGGSNKKNSEDPSAAEESKKPKSKSNAILIVIIVGSIILLLFIVGGAVFFIKQKKKSNQASTSTGIEKGASGVSSSVADESVKAIENIEKPNIQSQKANINKQQRPGATMSFIEDE